MNKRQKGFTLVELMIVVVIIGILAAVAYPSYRAYVVQSRWTEAKAALTQTAASLERCFTRFNAYNNAACPDVTLPINFDTPKGSYGITTTALTATTFTLQAAPAGAQAEDTRCGTFTLTNTNVRGVSGTQSVQDCW